LTVVLDSNVVVALAQELDAELWTLDGPLARNAVGVDLPVRLIDASREETSR
jgi:predicted nucleic acid-binding protein